MLGCCHSSVDSSAPTILQPWVQVPAHHLCFYHLQSNLCYICLLKRTEINEKEAGFLPFFKNLCSSVTLCLRSTGLQLVWTIFHFPGHLLLIAAAIFLRNITTSFLCCPSWGSHNVHEASLQSTGCISYSLVQYFNLIRSRCHKQNFTVPSLWYVEIGRGLSDWMFKVTWLLLTNPECFISV